MKSIRKKRGYIQKHVADKVGITNTSLSSIENDSERQPSFATILKLCDFYEVPVEVVFVTASKPSKNKEYEKAVKQYLKECEKIFNL